MRKSSFIITSLFSLFLFASCASDGNAYDDQTYDDLSMVAEEIAWEVLDIVRDRAPLVVVVYPFSGGADSEPMRETMAADITMFLANAAVEDDVALRVVTRQAIEAILKELSFQLNDIIDEGQRVKVGKLAGAQVMITGSYRSNKGLYEIRVQAVDIETGVVLGGKLYKYSGEGQ